MRILAMDTSSNICSVAIIEDGRVVKELHNESKLEHSQTLMPMIDEILRQTGRTLNDINLLACGVGPGSFTGIRVGIATVKAIADSKNIPIVGVNSLEAQTYALKMSRVDDDENIQNCKVLSMIDARNDNVYFAVYRIHNGNISVYKNADVMSLDNVTEFLNMQTMLYVVGTCNYERLKPVLEAEKQKEIAEGRDVAGYRRIGGELPTMAEAVGIAAINKYNLGIIDDSNSIRPKYLKKTSAEIDRSGEDEKLYLNEMSITDVEEVLANYDKFPNLWDERTFEEDFKNSNYVVAKLNNEVVGYISTRTVMNELEFINIVTRVDMYDKGIASNLISYVIRKNADVDRIHLEVNQKSENAMRLYRRYGFREDGRRKGYYSDGGDAVLMTLVI